MSVTIQAGTAEAAALQSEIQNELMSRGKAEHGDNTMAEYIAVMLVNQKTSDEINEELADLQGIDFDPTFTPWIFAKADEVTARFASSSSSSAAPPARPVADVNMEEETTTGRNSKASGNSRLFSTAVAPLASQPTRPVPSGPSAQVAGVKRGFSPVEAASGSDAYNKRRSLGNGGVPTGPRAQRQQGTDGEGRGKRSLLDRIGGPPLNPQAAEFGPGRAGVRNNFRPRPNNMQMPVMDPFMMNMMGMQGGFNFNGNAPDQGMMQEMFRQNQATMEQMQAMMFQMAQQMGTPPQAYATTISGQPAQQLGNHTISGRKPATLINKPSSSSTVYHNGSGGPAPAAKKSFTKPPERPTSQEICKFGVGCTNRSCGFSHPSPVATMESGMVLKTEACPEGLDCADKDCPYSHVSPSQKHGETSGQARVPCKFGDKCNNPACPFRHEDATGNWVPSPALTRPGAGSSSNGVPNDVDMADASQHDELDITLDLDSSAAGMAAGKTIGVPGKKMDGALGSGSGTNASGATKPMNGQIKVPCRFGAGCTNPTCRFQHGKACRFGKKCFDPRCSFVHPPDRQLNASINNDGFNSYKGGKTTLVDREFVKPGETVETVLPGGGGGGDGTGKAESGAASNSADGGAEIKVEDA